MTAARPPRNGPPGVFHVRADRLPKVRAQYPNAAIIRPDVPGQSYIVFGTVYDALPLELRL
jgi:hypothetical protein